MSRFVTALAVLILPFAPVIAAEPRKPNIVVILADDLGYADLGCQGCKDIPTPNIDTLAKNGIRCTSGYSNHPVCSPSRAGLMTGLYPQRFGFEHNSGPEKFADPKFGVPKTVPTLAEKLKAAGYATGMIGKWHIGFKEGLRPHERGFDYHFGFLSGAHAYLPGRKDNDPLVRNGKTVDDEKEYLTDAFAREAVGFIDRNKDGPFFLYVAFNAVHTPLQATGDYEKRFPEIKDTKRKTYAGMLSAMDDAVGKVLAKLRDLKLEENTLVVFYSDNGGPTTETSSRNDPLRGFKGQMYEGGVRVPFLWQWKGTLPAGKVYDPAVAGFDVHATALAAAGAAVPKDKPLDGVNLLPYLTGEKKDAPHEKLFWRAGPQHAARVGDWKLVSFRGTSQLFNLKDDLGEKTDLAAKEPAKFKELENIYSAWDKQMMPPLWVRQDAKNPGPKKDEPKKEEPKKEDPKADDTIATRFKQLDTNSDGKLSADELKKATPAVQKRLDGADKDKDGFLTLEEVRAHLGSAAPPAKQPEVAPKPKPKSEPTPLGTADKPALKPGPNNAAGKDAAGNGQLFESIHVAGLTDIRKGMNGFALADLNHDGRPDLVAVFTPPIARPEDPAKTGEVERVPLRQASDQLLVLINEGGFKFRSHTIEIRGSTLTNDKFGQRTQIPNLADFNGDGHLDILITRSAAMLAGKMRADVKDGGNTLLVSDGAWDKFRDLSDKLGIRNETGYNRQTSIADVNRDGWLDVAIGCDNIGNAQGGLPYSRLFVFKPNGPKFQDGKFEDIGGTDLVPDFGGFHHDSAKDKAGPGITLRDLDGDGDLDLLQSFHVDVREPLLPFSPGEYRQGFFCWKNQLVETGKLKFEKVTGNGFAAEARLKYNRDKQLYEPASDAKAPGLPYIAVADVDNDGQPDVFATGPSDRSWSPRVEYVGGRFWTNKGGFQFEERTKAAGLHAINNTYRQWYEFFDCPLSNFHKTWKPKVDKLPSQPGLAPSNPIDNRPYYADTVFGDFNNDGWQDVIVIDRRESPQIVVRSILFLNKGDGTFEPKPTTFSGLDAGGISGEAADLNGDGLLDLVVASDPDNTGGAIEIARYESKVYWNTGEHGARANHWLRLRFAGLRDAELIGAKVELVAGGQKQYRWVHSNHSYKSGGALDAHFGLGKHDKADVVVTLPGGKPIRFGNVAVDRVLMLDLKTGTPK
jgi:arylsulfatase A-like enzyme